jgi:hypothetical protein
MRPARESVVTISASALRSIFWVKFVHTLIFVFFAACIGVVVHSALTGWITLWTGVAFGLVMLEALIFMGNGWRCPLTNYAEALGAKNGSVADIFLPLWFAKRLPWISSVVFGLASLIVLLRLLR